MNDLQATLPYVRTDEHGVLRVGRGRVMLDAVVVAAFWEGHSPETIREQDPALDLEEVYDALAYSLAHTPEVDGGRLSAPAGRGVGPLTGAGRCCSCTGRRATSRPPPRRRGP